MDRCLAQQKELFNFICFESSPTAQALVCCAIHPYSSSLYKSRYAHTIALCFIRIIFTPLQWSVCGFIERERTKSYDVIRVLIISPLRPFYSLSTCELKVVFCFSFLTTFMFVHLPYMCQNVLFLFFIFAVQNYNFARCPIWV